MEDQPEYNLPQSHGKGVEIFVHLVIDGNTLYDHVINSVYIELYFGARVGMSQG